MNQTTEAFYQAKYGDKGEAPRRGLILGRTIAREVTAQVEAMAFRVARECRGLSGAELAERASREREEELKRNRRRSKLRAIYPC